MGEGFNIKASKIPPSPFPVVILISIRYLFLPLSASYASLDGVAMQKRLLCAGGADIVLLPVTKLGQ